MVVLNIVFGVDTFDIVVIYFEESRKVYEKATDFYSGHYFIYFVSQTYNKKISELARNRNLF